MTETMFGSRITYRRFLDLEGGNITGDLNRTQPQDYQIIADIQIQTLNDDLVKFGHVQVGDAEGFFKGRYDFDANNNQINPPIIPKNRDEIFFNGTQYRIKSAIPEYFSEDNIVFWDCMLVAIKDETKRTLPVRQPF